MSNTGAPAAATAARPGPAPQHRAPNKASTDNDRSGRFPLCFCRPWRHGGTPHPGALLRRPRGLPVAGGVERTACRQRRRAGCGVLCPHRAPPTDRYGAGLDSPDLLQGYPAADAGQGPAALGMGRKAVRPHVGRALSPLPAAMAPPRRGHWPAALALALLACWAAAAALPPPVRLRSGTLDVGAAVAARRAGCGLDAGWGEGGMFGGGQCATRFPFTPARRPRVPHPWAARAWKPDRSPPLPARLGRRLSP